MPALPTMLGGQLLTNGIRSTFANTYGQFQAKESPYLKNCFAMGLPSMARQEIYAYMKTQAYPRRTPQGDPTPFEATDSAQWTVTNVPYELGVAWHLDDAADDQTQTLMQQAMGAGQHFATLKERMFFELLNGTASLLPSIPNSPDGAAIFSATDGTGAARFGVSGGNIVTGSGVASAAAFRADLWKARARFRNFLDTKSQPLLDDGLLSRFTVVVPSGLEEVAREALYQPVTAAGALSSTSNAGVTNSVLTAGLDVKLWVTPRLSDASDWYVFADDVPHKPAFEQTRESLTEFVGNRSNSDQSRYTKEEYVTWRSRHGVGIGVPFGAVKINN